MLLLTELLSRNRYKINLFEILISQESQFQEGNLCLFRFQMVSISGGL